MFYPAVNVASLKEFTKQIPPPHHVWLILSEKSGHSGQKYPIPTVTVMLNLQAVSAGHEIIWLHDRQTVHILPGREFLSPVDKSIYDGYKLYYQLVQQYLIGYGYTVGEGQYSQAAATEPVRGVFECVQWLKSEQDETWSPVLREDESDD